MILQQCKFGHFYDCDKFAACPYCSLAENVKEEKTDTWSKNSLEKTQTVVGGYKLESDERKRI